MKRHTLFKLFYPAIALLLPLLSGCAEMPEVIESTRPRDPQLVAGPYVLLESAASPYIMRFRSDVPCVAGVRIAGKTKQTNRYGGAQKDHAVNISSLLPGNGPVELKLLLEQFTRATLHYNMASPGAPVKIAFLGGGEGQTASLQQAGDVIARINPALTIFTGGSFPLDGKIDSWENQFFAPLRTLMENSFAALLPEGHKIFPEKVLSSQYQPYWSRDEGCVHLVFLDMQSLREPASREKALQWLKADLAANQQPWCVLNLSKPLFGATRIHAQAVETLGTILESSGVDLVVSGGAKYYLRTLPVQAGGNGAVRYITTGGIDTSRQAIVGREYKAASLNQPHVCVLSANPNQLDWQVLPLNGTGLLDSVSIFADGSSQQGEPLLDKLDILTDALSTVTLQREVLTVARQSARAVDNPGQPQVWRFTISNASPREVKGELLWAQAPDSAYKIEPEAVRFDLKSGFEGQIDFTVKPTAAASTNAPMPELIVNMHGIGSARQQMIIAQQKKKPVTMRSGNIVIDGILSEQAWEDAAKFNDLVVMGSKNPPRQPLDARMTYDERGVYVVARCAADNPDTIAVNATEHDGPLYKDEGVEFFFDPQNQGREYYQFAVNVKGTTLERSSKLGLAWNPLWDTKVTRRKDFYTVEAFIPWSALGLPGMPATGSRWGVNIGRNDYGLSAVRENPFERTPAATDLGKGKITRFNIGALAEKDLGVSAIPDAKDGEKPKVVEGNGFEVVQWADTFGSNARSGLYGQVTFIPQRPNQPIAPAANN